MMTEVKTSLTSPIASVLGVLPFQEKKEKKIGILPRVY